MASLACTSSAFGAIVANFDAATSANYPGTAGGGWGGPWVTQASSSNGASWQSGIGSSFGSLSPGGGSYLGNVYQMSGNGFHYLSRPYASSAEADVDLTRRHTVTFQFRLDSPASDYTNLQRNYLYFTDDNVGGSFFQSAPTWIFGYSGIPNGSLPSRRFTVTDGNRAGAGVSVDTGFDLTTGTVYTFTVTSDPTTRSYDFAMTDGSRTFERIGLGWRSDVATVGGNLSFLGASNAQTTARRFDIDSVRIVQAVPEPTTLAVAAVGIVAVLRRRRRADRAS